MPELLVKYSGYKLVTFVRLMFMFKILPLSIKEPWHEKTKKCKDSNQQRQRSSLVRIFAVLSGLIRAYAYFMWTANFFLSLARLSWCLGFNRNCLGNFREIPLNQTTDVHRGPTLIMRVIAWRWRYITWHWRHRNHVNTITSVITAKQTA